jgi:hypothetical protein
MSIPFCEKLSDEFLKASPLDQKNPEPGKGNCYLAALEFIKRTALEGYKNSNINKLGIRLIHGIIDQDNNRVKHAWVEIDELFIDLSNKKTDIIIIDNLINKYNKIEAAKVFTTEEANKIATYKHYHNPNSSYYWGDLKEEEVKSINKENFEVSKSLFNNRFKFSDLDFDVEGFLNDAANGTK